VRPLTEEETKAVFEKLHKFIGKNIKALVERGDRPHCLRLQRNRVFYVREEVMRRATNVSRCGWLVPAGLTWLFGGARDCFEALLLERMVPWHGANVARMDSCLAAYLLAPA
jgi:hypothetical protein